MSRRILLSLPLLLATFFLQAQVRPLDSGGPLMPEQAAYDVTFYGMELEIFPRKQSIEGLIEVRAQVVQPMKYLVLDLHPDLKVDRVMERKEELGFETKGGKIWIDLGYTRQAREQVKVKVAYGGKPRVAPNPPWEGGFTWSETESGADWVATSCQTNGADLWWPCKDHVSDEPDSMALRITVPEPLVVATNGHFRGKRNPEQGKVTYDWYISTPINIYNVAMNIAPYVALEDEMKSVAGDMIPIVFYVLPEDEEKGKQLLPEIKEHLAFYEKYLGPYPFRKDKYGVVQTPHLGMEHQTIIAYGANFNNGSMTGGRDWGFDALHHHELGHEWWGNLVTNYDWKDMWLHEGTCSYMQAIYMEELEGKKGYHAYMNNMRFLNRLAIAPEEGKSSKEIYQAPIYTKGAWVLHSLRYLIGDEAFFTSLRRMCYPHPAMEAITDGAQCRFVTTDDFRLICEEESGRDLKWFFDVYLRQPALPILNSRVNGNTLSLRWTTPDDLPFEMPVEVLIDGKVQRVQVTQKGVEVKLEPGQKPEVDPDRWLMMEVK